MLAALLWFSRSSCATIPLAPSYPATTTRRRARAALHRLRIDLARLHSHRPPWDRGAGSCELHARPLLRGRTTPWSGLCASSTPSRLCAISPARAPIRRRRRPDSEAAVAVGKVSRWASPRPADTPDALVIAACGPWLEAPLSSATARSSTCLTPARARDSSWRPLTPTRSSRRAGAGVSSGR